MRVRSAHQEPALERSWPSLAYFIAAMLLNAFTSLAAMLYALNLWVEGQPAPHAARWWNPFRHVELVQGPIRPWTAFVLLTICAALGLFASTRSTRSPRLAVGSLVACGVTAYATGYFTPQPLVLWGFPVCLAYVAAAVLMLMAERERLRPPESKP